MPANIFEDGTYVEASATANAPQGIALLGISQQARPMIIHEHQMKFFRTVDFALLAWASNHGVITGHPLPCASSTQHGEQSG